VTIRAKLYAAIVLTILGPLATTAVSLHAMSQLGDRFDEVRARAQDEALARELKFGVTDVNGWQTAYGYDNGHSRPKFVHSVGELRAHLREANATLTDTRERAKLAELRQAFGRFMALDAVSWRDVQAGRNARVREILLGPEIKHFEATADAAGSLAAYEVARSAAAERAFDDARDSARRRLIAVALGAGVVIVLLLLTANDVARLALEGERRTRSGPSERSREPDEEGPP
jgi:hypothetical protein